MCGIEEQGVPNPAFASTCQSKSFFPKHAIKVGREAQHRVSKPLQRLLPNQILVRPTPALDDPMQAIDIGWVTSPSFQIRKSFFAELGFYENDTLVRIMYEDFIKGTDEREGDDERRRNDPKRAAFYDVRRAGLPTRHKAKPTKTNNT